MAVSAFMYGQAIAKAFAKEVNWLSDNIKVALVTSSYTPSQDTHAYWADANANEVTGTGYTAGGATLASKSLAYDAGTNTVKLSAANAQWPASTITARYAVVYDDSPATNATKPILGLVDLGANESTSNTTFEIVWAATGIFTIAAA